MDDIRVTVPRPVAEATVKMLEREHFGYDEPGRLAAQFYDLLVAALLVERKPCEGCPEAEEHAS